MKTQAIKELHTKSIAELTQELKDAREVVRQLRLEKEMGRLKNTSSLRQKRTEVAVLQTIMHEKAASEKKTAVDEQGKEADGKNAKVERKKEKSTSAKAPASAKAKAGRSADKEPVRKSQGKGGKKV